MAVIPHVLNQLLQGLDFLHIYDQNFGLDLEPSDIFRSERALCSTPLHAGYRRPWRAIKPENSGVSTLISDKEGLKVSLDVQHFKPEELSVKIVDNFLVVEGRHEERSDEHGFISRQFTRRYRLPDNVDKDAIESTFSSDNVLQLIVPKKVKKEERNIPISKINIPVSPFTSPKPPAEKRFKIDVGA